MNKLFRISFALSLLISGILTFISCEKYKDNGKLNATFLIGSKGTDEHAKGLYTYKPGSDPEFISTYFPHNYSSYYADENNGIVAFTLPSQYKDGTSGIAYFNVTEPENIQFAPIPTAPDGYYYGVNTITPQVLKDGRIAYLVSLETDSPYDAWFAGMIAIFNPATNDIELSGDPTDFVLAQPEILADTEDGTMKTGFCISPDDQYAYCEVYGYGTEGGDVHRDYSFIVRYTIGSPGSYERITQMEALPAAVTGDGNYLILAGSFGTRKFNLVINTLHDVASYFLAPSSGQVSALNSKVLRGWRAAGDNGAGFGELNLGTFPDEFVHIIDGRKIESPINYYPRLDLGFQYSKDESRTYFGIYQSSQSDKYINICSSPIIELNETPDILGHISTSFNMDVFMLISE